MSLRVDDVTWAADGTTILHGVDLTARAGRITGLIGPNGSGKTSILRCVARLHRHVAGIISLDDTDLATLRRRELGRRMALVEQDADTDLDLTVMDIVLLGRTPYRRPLQGDTDHDHATAMEALATVDLAGLADRRWVTLSGGERQRAQLARAICQEPRLLLLDEPTNHLDLGHQLRLLSFVRASALTALAALHDVNLAAMYCDALVLLDGGRVRAHGSVRDVLTPDLLAEVYGVDADVVEHPTGDHPVVVLNGPVHEGARPDRRPRSSPSGR